MATIRPRINTAKALDTPMSADLHDDSIGMLGLSVGGGGKSADLRYLEGTAKW